MAEGRRDRRHHRRRHGAVPHHRSQQTAARLYPLGSSNPTLGGAGMVAAQQQANTDRTSAELQFFNDCMEGRGYTRGPKS